MQTIVSAPARAALAAAVFAFAVVLALATLALAADPVIDPTGDATGGAPDITQITVIPNGAAIDLRLGFVTTDWPADSWQLGITIASARSNTCSGNVGPYFIAMPAYGLYGAPQSPGPALGVFADPTEAVLLDYAIDERSITITIPRARIGDPDVLNFSVHAIGASFGIDDSPDGTTARFDGEIQTGYETCHSVDLGSISPNTAVGRSSGSVPILVGVGSMLLAAAVALACLQVPEGGGGEPPVIDAD